MKQDADIEALVRQRIRGLRAARGWSLDELARRCQVSPSNLSRIETGHRRLALDQLMSIAQALGTSLDQLVESADDEDVVIRPVKDESGEMTTWMLTTPGRSPRGVSVAKVRITRSGPRDHNQLRVHPGRDWFTVLSGTARLQLGERTILVRTGQAAEFSTMTPHAFSGHEGPVEVLCIFDHDGDQAHLHQGKASRAAAGRARAAESAESAESARAAESAAGSEPAAGGSDRRGAPR